jgi:oligoribonuclease
MNTQYAAMPERLHLLLLLNLRLSSSLFHRTGNARKDGKASNEQSVMSMTEPSSLTSNLIWIDLEMTGLDTTTDEIIEIATIVTDRNLNEIAEGPVLAVHQPRSVMDNMDAWNTKQHRESGLVDRVLASDLCVSHAEQQTLNFLKQHVEQGASPMCGNSICQDRRFLARQMPLLEAFFHYRNLDVSSLKILAQLWAPAVAKGFTKESTHRALQDIRDSIGELRYYRETLFAPQVLEVD